MRHLLVGVSILVIIMAGCKNGEQGFTATGDKLPAPGAIIVQVAMPVAGEQLNHFMFAVTLTADSSVKEGIYDVCASYGFDTARGKFIMPKGLTQYKLAIKKGAAPTTYIIGFYMPDDPAFNDYFEISGKRSAIGMHYTKAYTFE